MEVIHGTRKAPQDFISRMPDNVVTNILDRLPLQDAVRTANLEKKWRFKWTLLSQLVFDERFYFCLMERNGDSSKFGRVINKLLLHIKGAITKFSLCIFHQLDDADIAHWILFLSEKGVKDLTICNEGPHQLKMPSHLFSCLELKHLKLYNCCLNHPPTFQGFPNLLSLELRLVRFKSDIGEFITCCPSLEILISTSILKAVWIAKLENIRILSISLPLCDRDTMMSFQSCSTVFELLDSLPKLQELELDFQNCKLIEDGVNKRFSPAFPSLKALKLSRVCLEDGMKLSCAFELIRSFPNLQTLEITTSTRVWHNGGPPRADYNKTGLLQLRSVIFEYSKGSENELCFLKYLLVRSPFLKKIVIRPHCFSTITLDGKLEFASKLLKVHRASPVVDIDLS
ncbi:F-box/FBD/LRR-repeat protein At1g13570-like [Bidens hawaiensis]|uniref:F-box/FBD/LRR-repeat protein At1g13570-like n=1 Tax=Bidens hawaiensis TaxID=980011 RepID=UPI004049C4D2